MDFMFMRFVFVNYDTTLENYDYAGYINRNGKVLIIRTDKETTNARYFMTNDSFENIWTNRETLNYQTPDKIKI